MTLKLFITGTDTDVGKTYISVSLLKACRQRGLSTLGIKPVASGCLLRDGQYVSEDALALQHASSLKLPLEHINPFAFPPPIAPHLAAQEQQIELTLQHLNHLLQPALSYPVDVCLIEGAGGLYVPLNQTETWADFIIQQSCHVILVVGLRLGCINHAILTQRALEREGIQTRGWIANQVDANMSHVSENIATLRQFLPTPCLGVVKQHEEIEIIDWLYSSKD